jgi:hypothetical protein
MLRGWLSLFVPGAFCVHVTFVQLLLNHRWTATFLAPLLAAMPQALVAVADAADAESFQHTLARRARRSAARAAAAGIQAYPTVDAATAAHLAGQETRSGIDTNGHDPWVEVLGYPGDHATRLEHSFERLRRVEEAVAHQPDTPEAASMHLRPQLGGGPVVWQASRESQSALASDGEPPAGAPAGGSDAVAGLLEFLGSSGVHRLRALGTASEATDTGHLVAARDGGSLFVRRVLGDAVAHASGMDTPTARMALRQRLAEAFTAGADAPVPRWTRLLPRSGRPAVRSHLPPAYAPVMGGIRGTSADMGREIEDRERNELGQRLEVARHHRPRNRSRDAVLGLPALPQLTPCMFLQNGMQFSGTQSYTAWTLGQVKAWTVTVEISQVCTPLTCVPSWTCFCAETVA